MTRLADMLRPCGPTADPKAAERALEIIAPTADAEGWSAALQAAWPALAPVFGASSYLAGLARRRPAQLGELLLAEPGPMFEVLLQRAVEAGDMAPAEAGAVLRRAKAAAHLLIALADLGGVWTLDEVTGALTRLADTTLSAALRAAARAEVEAGRLMAVGEGAEGPVPGYFGLAMGKQGAFELNYSSDIDISVFYHPERLPVTEDVEPRAFAVRLTQAVAALMQDRTEEGYVFRVDLRLRPDPSSTPLAVTVAAAFEYYETVGQNWERAAFIKARPCLGDVPAAQTFLDELSPFIWRKNLDFAAIADIHSIKRQIHVHKVDERLDAKGADLKLGRGGIREIEFYVQTQQLILGGRHPELRSPRTLQALADLSAAGHVTPEAARELHEAYEVLRAVEHRVQMIADEQTHRLPEADGERGRVAALHGHKGTKTFDKAITETLTRVNRRYGELFPDEEALSSSFGSLIFTGVDDDPATLKTLKQMGFDNPPQVSQTIRSWHHGRIAATRTERGRELFTRLAPRLLEAAHATGAPNAAFNRFTDFFAGLSSGVQIQSLFLANPKLFELLVQVMAFAPKLAATLARRPAALDALIDGDFFAEIDPAEDEAVMALAIARADGFEEIMDAVRRVHREQAFRLGVQVMSGVASAARVGRGFADLAYLCIRTLAPAALAEAERIGGTFPGQVAVVALGKCGSREMSAGSDLDLMTLYRPDDPRGMSSIKAWGAETFYGRFTQRLIAALSLPTAEGELYEVDMQLRPSGTQGPVAVSRNAFEAYYAGEAETWELLALTRARVVWASTPEFQAEASGLIEAALRRPRDRKRLVKDVRAMRTLLEKERPARDFWDMKLNRGGLVDIEFAAQFLQLAHAAENGPLAPHTATALGAFREAGLGPAGPLEDLEAGWRLQQNITQLLKLALDDDADPAAEPTAFRRLLARAAGVDDFKAVKPALERARKAARNAYDIIVQP